MSTVSRAKVDQVSIVGRKSLIQDLKVDTCLPSGIIDISKSPHASDFEAGLSLVRKEIFNVY